MNKVNLKALVCTSSNVHKFYITFSASLSRSVDDRERDRAKMDWCSGNIGLAGNSHLASCNGLLPHFYRLHSRLSPRGSTCVSKIKQVIPTLCSPTALGGKHRTLLISWVNWKSHPLALITRANWTRSVCSWEAKSFCRSTVAQGQRGASRRDLRALND